jgi:formamidopyrimidine-DNA glycosylase
VPELPEVEVLVRHLQRTLPGKIIRKVQVNRAKSLRPTSERDFRRVLTGAKFKAVSRRAKYLLFELLPRSGRDTIKLLGHLGMTGRMFLAPKNAPIPKHTPVVLDLGETNFIYEDFRYFGRLSLDVSVLEKLGPEPLTDDFTPESFARELKRSRQSIKIKLLDQTLIAGVGNIYASEALFRAHISPKKASNRLNLDQVKRLHAAIREVLVEAIGFGSTVPVNFGNAKSDGLFYFGKAPGALEFYEERLRIYDRTGEPCPECGTSIRRIVQAARSTFFCPTCQKV